MNGIVRILASSVIGLVVSDMVSPKAMEMLKPESDFAKKAVRYGVVGGSTAAAWYLLGAVGVGK